MSASAPCPDRQPCLFEALPETEPRRRRGRRPPKPPAAPPEPGAAAPEPGPPAGPGGGEVVAPFSGTPPPPADRAAAEPVRFEITALTNPELSELVAALTESSLGFLLVEVVQEVKRRLSPAEACDDDEAAPAARRPNPQLLRALRTATLELSENE